MVVTTNIILRRSLRAKAPIPRLSMKKKRRGSTKKMNPESREGRGSSTRSGFIIDKEERALNKHHLNKAYWEKHYQISIPEEVWTKDLRQFMRKHLFLRKFLKEDNTHGYKPT